MKRTFCCVLGVLFVCMLSGCKSEPKPTAPVPVVETRWQWPLSDERLADLRDIPVEQRNRILSGMAPPTYEIHRVAEAVTVDGVLDEADWQRASVVRMRDVGHGTPAWYATTVRMLYDDANLYVAFECDDPNVVSSFKDHDDPLWREDAVNLMIDADGDEQGYVELMVSPSNVLYDAVWADFREDADWFVQPTWERFDLDSTLDAYRAAEVTSAVKVDGTLNESDDTDKGYIVELAIPFAALREVRFSQVAGKAIDMHRAALTRVDVPGPGTEWRMNLLRSNPSTPLLVEGEQSAWSPTGASVHMPCAFGRVRFMND